jgi:hypothetical protein
MSEKNFVTSQPFEVTHTHVEHFGGSDTVVTGVQHKHAAKHAARALRYERARALIQALKLDPNEPVFTTTVHAHLLWKTYLQCFDGTATAPGSEAQHYNCNACKAFLKTYGGLVTVDDKGRLNSLVFTEEVCAAFPEFQVLRDLVEGHAITGVFVSEAVQWGIPENEQSVPHTFYRRWQHLAVRNTGVRFKHATLAAHQFIALKTEGFGQVRRFLDTTSAVRLTQARDVLQAHSLVRAEKALPQVLWLLERAQERRVNGTNKLWKAVAKAPEGFLHPSAGMVGVLVEALAAGKSMENIKRLWAEKMDPLAYQRPTAPPAEQTIDRAEALLAKLGIGAAALDRRFANAFDLGPGTVWTPSSPAFADEGILAGGGLFSDLRVEVRAARKSTPMVDNSSPKLMTWTKFSQEVLPLARNLGVTLGSTAAHAIRQFTAQMGLVWATNGGGQKLFRWAHPVASYGYRNGSFTRDFFSTNEAGAVRFSVERVVLHPQCWPGAMPAGAGGGFRTGVTFILRSCYDRQTPGLALFPETLRGDLHEVRDVFELLSNRRKLKLPQPGGAGLDLYEGSPAVRLRVTTDTLIYDVIVDRMS